MKNVLPTFIAILLLLFCFHLYNKLEVAQATADAALNAAIEARALAFEAKRIAEDKQVAPAPVPSSCDPESGRCHRGYTYREFMGGKP